MKFLKVCLLVACIALIAAKELKKDNKIRKTNLVQKEKAEASNKVKTQCDCNENKEKFLSSNTGCSSYKMGGCGKATCIHSDCNLDIATWKYNWDWEFSSKFFFIIYGSDIGSPSALSAQAKTLNMNVGTPVALNDVLSKENLESLKSYSQTVKASKTQELSLKTPVLESGSLKFSSIPSTGVSVASTPKIVSPTSSA